MQYRREIDGLRAIAVLPVILFHAGAAHFGGGFAGVDVFFVISGYLITALILQGKEKADFSLWRFYAHRARRILPALYTVMLACIVFAWAWMPPVQYVDFSKSLQAAALSVSNIYFGGQGGYFDTAIAEKPLIHTWSLGIEGQFYILFPLLVMGVWRFGRARLAGPIAILAVASFAFAEVAAHDMADEAFFMTFARVWELFAGALCACALKDGAAKTGNALSLLGLGLITTGFVLVDESTRWPSAYTLLPVAGTALVIMYAGKDTLAAKALSLRPLVGLGLISYSAYLWHQPLFAFARIRSLADPSQDVILTLAVVSLALAWATWRFIERPFYAKSVQTPPRPVVSGFVFWPVVAVLAGVILSLAQNGIASDGLPDRPAITVPMSAKTARNNNPFRATCNSNPGETPVAPVNGKCWINNAPDKSIAILGDSHADAIAYGIAKALEESGLNLYQRTRGNCPVTLAAATEEKCLEFNRQTMDWLASDAGKDIDTVILATRWVFFIEGTRFDNGEGGVEHGKKVDVRIVDTDGKLRPGSRAEIASAIAEGVRELLARGKQVVLIYPIPEAGWNVPNMVFKQLNFEGEIKALSTSYDRYLTRNKTALDTLDSIDDPGVIRFYPAKILCDEKTRRCRNADKDGVLYFDDDHLNNTGAAVIAAPLRELIDANRP